MAIEGRSPGLYDHLCRRTHDGFEISVDISGTWPPWIIFITLPYGLSGKRRFRGEDLCAVGEKESIQIKHYETRGLVAYTVLAKAYTSISLVT
jgi:hypothetical protein